ncbi:MAG TPA: VCBS repeat-containing protein [Candidatus Krumholzibacteria bacterium]|nr:VCBS repeat-containing protein [Candidatus Krumholzibacteria bacterium]
MGTLILVILFCTMAGTATAKEKILFEWNKGEAGNFGGVGFALGDINGDGAADIALRLQDEIDVFFGGTDADDLADLVIAPPSGPHPGFPLQGPIDLNGDGQDDLIVAANGATREGPIYCYWGGAAVDDIPDYVVHGSWTAASACRAGAFMPNDMIDDFAVAKTETNYNYVDVYEGGEAPAEEPSWGRIEYLKFALWEYHFCYAGDFNNDGYGDIVTGAPLATSVCLRYETVQGWCSDGGQVFLYWGGPERLRGALIVHGNEDFIELGFQTSANCDLNADGYSDVVSTADGADQTWAIFGRPGYPSRILQPSRLLAGGRSATALGDINGDGADDVATRDNSGQLRIFLGSATFDTTEDAYITLPPEDTRAFKWLFRVNDFDGDGYDDIGVTLGESVADQGLITSYRIYSGLNALAVPVQDQTVGGLKSLFHGIKKNK